MDKNNELRGLLVDFLQKRRGQGKVISAADLAICIGIEDREGHPTTRALIRGIISDGYPIGATSDGYFWLSTERELQEYVGVLAGRASKITERAEIVADNYYREHYRGESRGVAL